MAVTPETLAAARRTPPLEVAVFTRLFELTISAFFTFGADSVVTQCAEWQLCEARLALMGHRGSFLSSVVVRDKVGK